MANTFHDQLTGSDLHDSKVYPATGSELSSWTPTDGRYTRQSRSIATTAPLTGGGTLVADRTLSIPAATGAIDGYLKALDWETFNGKQASLGYTPLNRAGDTMTGNLIAALFDHGGQLYSVKAYGAACDGVTDDTTAIRSAITAMGSAGGILFLPGFSRTSASIDLPDNIHVCGAGMGTSGLIASFSSAVAQGIFSLSNKSNVTICGLKFTAGGNIPAINSYGHQNLVIRNNYFTGTSNSNFGCISLDGQTSKGGVADMKNTLIEGNTFDGLTLIDRTIHLFPSNGHLVEDTKIVNNRFHNCRGPAVFLDCSDTLRGTLVQGNSFLDLTDGGTVNTPGVAIMGSISANYQTFDTIISGNYYRNTLTTAGQQEGFVYIYAATNTTITNNICIGSWTTSQNTTGPCIAPGRVSSPMIDLTITGNKIRGFDAAWDPDAMKFVEVSGNTVYECGGGFGLGYGVTSHVRIHHNITYNSPYQSPYSAGVIFGNANYVHCEYSSNVHIDDRAVPVLTRAIELTGNYDFRDVIVKDNEFYVPNGTFTSGLIYRELGNEQIPRLIEGNILHDLTGITCEFPYAQGNVNNATTFNVANGAIITATFTANITVTFIAGTIKGQTLELRLTQDATGSRTVTWPSNFKKAGGGLVLSTMANAQDIVTVRWDSVNWVEVSRALNVS